MTSANTDWFIGLALAENFVDKEGVEFETFYYDQYDITLDFTLSSKMKNNKCVRIKIDFVDEEDVPPSKDCCFASLGEDKNRQ